MKAHKREVPRCLERTSAARRKEENLCLHEDIISSRICALITAKKRRTAVSYSSAECCLERTNFARTKRIGLPPERAWKPHFRGKGFRRLCEMSAFLSEFFLWTNYRGPPWRFSSPPGERVWLGECRFLWKKRVSGDFWWNGRLLLFVVLLFLVFLFFLWGENAKKKKKKTPFYFLDYADKREGRAHYN